MYKRQAEDYELNPLYLAFSPDGKADTCLLYTSQFSVIMGAKAKVTSKNGKGVLEYAWVKRC